MNHVAQKAKTGIHLASPDEYSVDFDEGVDLLQEALDTAFYAFDGDAEDDVEIDNDYEELNLDSAAKKAISHEKTHEVDAE